MKRGVIGSTVVAMLVAGAVSASTLTDVVNKGFVQCGVSQGLPGFSSPDAEGNWQGIDVDVCRAVAAAKTVVGVSSNIQT